jgi:hypothetical protein
LLRLAHLVCDGRGKATKYAGDRDNRYKMHEVYLRGLFLLKNWQVWKPAFHLALSASLSAIKWFNGLRLNVGRLERLNVSPLIKEGGGIQNLCAAVDARFYKSSEGDRFAALAMTWVVGKMKFEFCISDCIFFG